MPLKPLEGFKPKKKTTINGVKLGNRALGVLLAGATLIGGLVAVVTLLPRVTSSISDPVDPNNPFSSSVTITNSGYIPLASVEASIAVIVVKGDGSVPTIDIYGLPHYKSRINNVQWRSHYLNVDDRFTIALNEITEWPREHLGKADIAIVIDYEIPIIHLPREKIFPIYARKQSNGNFYWYSNSQN
jgi:hypothetical protein